jgi:hypothetical protein
MRNGCEEQLNSTSEVVRGEIAVSVQLAFGSERLRLFVTTRRVLVAHEGKRGAGGFVVTNILGRLGGVLEDLFKSGRESVARKKLNLDDPQEILDAHKDNFAVGNDEIVRVDLDEDPRIVMITILTKDDKFEFYTRQKIETLEALLEKNFRDKLFVERLPT